MVDMDERTVYGRFTGNVFVSLAEENPEENLVFSPLSILVLLSMAAQAAGGETRDEIVEAITGGCPGYKELVDKAAGLQRFLAASGDPTSANAVLVRREISGVIRTRYKQDLRKVFAAPLIKSDDLVTDGNAWIKQATDGMIPEIMNDSTKDVLLCMINAIIFQARWQEEYEEEDIRTGSFRNADGTNAKPQMLQSVEDSYFEDEYYTGFAKPYSGRFCFVGLLPKRKDRRFFEKALERLDFAALTGNCTYDPVHVTMPEFACEYGGDLAGLCKELGMQEMFSDDADFSTMSTGRLKISQIIHKARIEVNRNGTKAAAATMAGFMTGCLPGELEKPKKVVLNRPFVYAVVDKETGLPIFVGTVQQL